MAGRSCLCGAVGCTRHGRRQYRPRVPGAYDAEYTANRAHLVATWNANRFQVCWICKAPRRATDPWEPDHVQPVAVGGTSALANLRPAHRSCNRKRGARMRKASTA